MIEAKETLSGFYLDFKIKKAPDSCESLNDEILILSYLWAKQVEEIKKFQAMLTKCLGKDAKKYIAKRASLHNNQNSAIKKLNLLLTNKRLINFDLLSSKFGINQMGGSLKDIDSLPEGVVKEIFQMYVYAMMGNTGKVNEILRMALNRHYSYRYFNFQKNYEIERGKLDDVLYLLLTKINDKTSNKQLLKLYLRHQARSYGLKFEFEMLSRFDLLLTTDQLNDITRSPLYGYRYPGLWYPEVLEKKGANKALQFLEKSYPVWKDNVDGNMWLYGHVRPKEEKRRKQIIKNVERSFRSTDAWSNEVKFLLLDDLDFKLFYEKYSKKKIKPLFVLRKIFYQNQMTKDQGIEYSLYKLLQIGAMPLSLVMGND